MTEIDRPRAEQAIAEFLAALGYEGDFVAQAPARMTAAFADEFLRGREIDIPRLVAEGSEPAAHSEVVVLKAIEVVTVCPHHLTVAKGLADLAYIPGDRVLGLGTLCRLVEAKTRRLTLQEEIAPQVVDTLMQEAGATAAYFRLTLDHMCLQARGPEQSNTSALTWAVRGRFEEPDVLGVLLHQLDAES